MNLEEYLDEEYRLLRVTPYVCHIQPLNQIPGRPRAVTIVTTYQINKEAVRRGLQSIETNHRRSGPPYQQSLASYTKESLEMDGCAGVAVCDYRDQFNRQRGRIIAKGRLFKLLRKERAER